MKIKNTLMLLLGLGYLSLVTACGSSGAVVHKSIKDFRLSIDPKYKQLEPTFASLIDSFNEKAGFNALQLVSAAEKGNSNIIITDGLTNEFHKVGFGQWVIETQEHRSVTAQGTPITTKIDHYEMKLEFDQSFVKNLALDKDSTESRYELEKLFFHEVGHGMQMDHVSSEDDVMYENIGGKKDFDQFFARVREFYAR